MTRRLVALVVLAPLALAAKPATDDAAVRSELLRQYAQIDAALEQKRPEDALRVAHPEARVQYGVEDMSFATTISQLKQAVQNGAAIQQRTSIVSLDVAGSRATVRRRSEAAVTMGGQTRTGVEQSEDTWVHTPGGWRLLLVKAIGSVEAPSGTSSAGRREVVNEIAAHARSIDDLDAICEAIGDARVVALGEATHGTSEFSAIRARLVERLAQRKGFTVVAVEDNWTEAAAIDEYMKAGSGDARTAPARLKGWPFRTREMLSLIEAMRARNERISAKMSFAGFDMTWS